MPPGASSPIMEMRRQVVGTMQVNAYAVICTRTGHSVLIDPGDEAEALQDLMADSLPTAILVTHRHPDHVGALASMRQILGAPVLAFGKAAGNDPVRPDRLLADDERVAVGNLELRIQHTPGHTDDQICVAVTGDPHVFVGDTLFPGGPGNTNSPAAFRTTLDTLRRYILSWPDETICCPGHGPFFQLGGRRKMIEAFVNQNHGDFFGDAVWQM